MAGAKKTKAKGKKAKAFTFQLGWSGLAGVTVVAVCLFFWMFILGVWAGQTILLPPGKGKAAGERRVVAGPGKSVEEPRTIQPELKKRAVN